MAQQFINDTPQYDSRKKKKPKNFLQNCTDAKSKKLTLFEITRAIATAKYWQT